MTDGATRELVFVLIIMGALLLFGVAAVVVFVRTWRKEKKK